jgi:hypothetical protein
MLLESINYRFRKTSEGKLGKNQNGKDVGAADSKEEAT